MDYIIALIFAAAAEYAYVSSRYGWRMLYGKRNWHTGIDIATHGRVVPMYWIFDGYVSAKGYSAAAGNYIYITCPILNKKFYLYHMDSASPLKKGQAVTLGTLFGYCGTTGNSTGVHLHISVVDLTSGEFEDPEIYFKEFQQLNEVKPISQKAIRLKIGGSTGADTKAIKAKLDEYIPNKYQTLKGGVFITDVEVTSGDQVYILRVTKPLGVECVEYVEPPVVIDVGELQKENEALKAKVNALRVELETDKDIAARYIEQNAKLETTLSEVNAVVLKLRSALTKIATTATEAAKGE